MKEKIILFIKRNRVTLTLLIYAVALLFLTKKPIIGWGIFYVPIVIYFITKVRKFNELKNRWISILFATGALFFIGKVLAENILNMYYQIHIEYIGNSSVILGVIIAIILWMIFYTLFYLVINIALSYIENSIITTRILINFFEKIFKTNFLSKNKIHAWLQAYEERYDGMTIMVSLGILTFCIWSLFNLSSVFPYILLSDAHLYTDCIQNNTKETEQQFFHVRKNSKECYQIKFENPPKYIVIPLIDK